MFAVVDIETTGGHAAGNSITEIAIHLTDGERVVEAFESLVNPQQPIPRYIQALTGISQEMVEKAPAFEDLARKVYEMLQGNIFVAHNVNFDYSFVKHQLQSCGYSLQAQKLCTVQLSRKIVPGLHSYSLGTLCRCLQIPVNRRHRAGGDAAATAKLLELLISKDVEGHLASYLRKRSPAAFLPMHLPQEALDGLPHAPGVYYFHDRKGKIIYVGKARDLKKRVSSHFTNNNASRQRQEFLRNIYNLSFEVCATELMALILESIEIRRCWPAYNRSQKHFQPSYGLYCFEDQNGYMRLAIEKRKKHLSALFTFHLLVEGHALLRRLVRDFDLCPRLCFLQKDHVPCTGTQEYACKGACEQKESPGDYNRRVKEAMESLRTSLPTFAVIQRGRKEPEQACMYMERGHFYGMGYIEELPAKAETLKERITPYPDNGYIRNLLLQFASRYPEQVRYFSPPLPADNLLRGYVS